MFKDLQQFLKVQKLKAWREATQGDTTYYDGLENLFIRLHPGKMRVKVSDISLLTPDVKLFRLVPARRTKVLAPFRAGQYVGLSAVVDGVHTTRPYSLVSSPNQLAYYEIGVRKKMNGFISPHLFENAKEGDEFEITEPMGNFYYNSLFHGDNLGFIAGGCGVTPFIAMLRDITERKIPLNVWLLYGCLKEEDILYRKELEDMQARRPNIHVQYILSEPGAGWTGPMGFISKDKISQAIGSVEKKFFYIVGNRPMYQFVLPQLAELGISPHRVIREVYGVPDSVKEEPGWPTDISLDKKVTISIQYAGMEKTIQVACGEPLLNGIERAHLPGLQVNSGCRSGECGLCRTKLLSGNVFVPAEVMVREADKANNFIHPCATYPLTDLRIELLGGD